MHHAWCCTTEQLLYCKDWNYQELQILLELHMYLPLL